ncbi:hypothetical protein [Nocardiopsis sp. NRRL B-16309]|uniref:hypothetical protein n=1 Tax=Nocardiopsis sp. NRRL B-16309 TaxID=1519494 RepID=UPI0012E1F320|nr:hypothetical protein [Nocardiopsis sp. NRRL B-16309]
MRGDSLPRASDRRGESALAGAQLDITCNPHTRLYYAPLPQVSLFRDGGAARTINGTRSLEELRLELSEFQ